MRFPVSCEGRIVGYVEDDTYHTSRRRKDHFFRKYRGWALSLSVLEKIERLGGRATIFNIEGEDPIVADLADWRNNGIPYDNNGDRQLILRESVFKRMD